jgi:hypothetical protein
LPTPPFALVIATLRIEGPFPCLHPAPIAVA